MCNEAIQDKRIKLTRIWGHQIKKVNVKTGLDNALLYARKEKEKHEKKEKKL